MFHQLYMWHLIGHQGWWQSFFDRLQPQHRQGYGYLHLYHQKDMLFLQEYQESKTKKNCYFYNWLIIQCSKWDFCGLVPWGRGCVWYGKKIFAVLFAVFGWFRTSFKKRNMNEKREIQPPLVDIGNFQKKFNEPFHNFEYFSKIWIGALHKKWMSSFCNLQELQTL